MPARSLSELPAKTSNRRPGGNDDRSVSTTASAEATLWAQSSTTSGRRPIAELFGVIEADARDKGDGRDADVRRIEAAAEAHFQHDRGAAPAHEVQEADRGRHFEKRQPLLAGGAHLVQQSRQLGVRDRLA